MQVLMVLNPDSVKIIQKSNDLLQEDPVTNFELVKVELLILINTTIYTDEIAVVYNLLYKSRQITLVCYFFS